MHIKLEQIIFTIINFIILLAVLKHFAWAKVQAVIQERQKSILNKIQNADNKVKNATELEAKNEALLKSARDEGKKITETKKKQAEKIYNEIVENARVEADAIRERANGEINRELEKAKFEIKEQVVELAMVVSKKALNESLDEAKHRELIDSFINEVV